MLKKHIKLILKDSGILTEEKFEEYARQAKKENKNIINHLIEKKIISSSLFYKMAADYFKLPFVELKGKNISRDTLLTIPETTATAHKVIAYGKNEKEIKLATTEPANLEIFEFIRKKTGLNPVISLTTPEDIQESIKKYHKNLKNEFSYDGSKESKSKIKSKDLEKITDMPAVKIVDTLMDHAIYQDASDVHIEPEEKKVIIRYRIDGVLYDIVTLPKKTHSGIVSRIKILANLKIDEHKMPQDGRFKIYTKKYKISFRVSIIPTFNGEKIVIRLLNESAQMMNLSQLGIQKKELEKVKRNIKKPYGEILVTGPTGSGKTTTLYTILNILNSPKINISTIEDPIEYHISRINQSQINNKVGFTFAQGLRALLRQDPDIIMVGEIRDKETAEIATHASMTGHLILSTLHTNDTVSTISRMNNLGIPSFLIANNINIIIAQRLVRKICPNCIQSYEFKEEAAKELNSLFNVDKILKTLKEEKVISSEKKDIRSLRFYKGKGCSQCNNTGYKGRVGIYEILENTKEITDLIVKKGSEAEIKKQAEKEGMITMIEDAFIKARNGITTIEEIVRAAQE
ncbi:MAG: GspE/PulE family protein [Patescibacteria group bacterium]